MDEAGAAHQPGATSQVSALGTSGLPAEAGFRGPLFPGVLGYRGGREEAPRHASNYTGLCDHTAGVPRDAWLWGPSPTWRMLHGAALVPDTGALVGVLALDEERRLQVPSLRPRARPRTHVAHGREAGRAFPVERPGARCPGVPAPRELAMPLPARCGLAPGEEPTPKGSRATRQATAGMWSPFSGPRFPHLSNGDNKPWWDEFLKQNVFQIYFTPRLLC